MPRHENTKEMLITESLKLFADRGYDGVKITDIAKAIDCVPSALYKHYENKETLYNKILEESIIGFQAALHAVKADFKEQLSNEEELLKMTEEEQINRTVNLFKMALNNEQSRAFRKLMVVEQFHKPELAQMYDERYVEMPVQQFEALFSVLMKNGLMVEGDPHVLAMTYAAPMTVLIGVCDRKPEKEEWAVDLLVKHIKEFNKRYKLQ